MSLESSLVGLVFAVAGLAVAGYGGLQLRTWHRIRSSDPVSVRDAAIESGPVELEGRVRPLEEPLSSPLQNESCVAYEYTVEERRRRRRRSNSNSNSNRNRRTWETIDSGRDRQRFVLEDDSGRAVVDPAGARLTMANERTHSIDSRSQLPPGLQSGVSTPISIDIGGLSIGSRPTRYTERRLDVDDTVYVYGQVEPNPPESDALLAVSDGPDAPQFLISDADESTTMRRFLKLGAGTIALGLALLGIGGFVIVESGIVA